MSANTPLDNLQAVSNLTSVHHDTYPFISPDKTDLSGKSVFVAGASKGIGRETALALAKSGCSKIAIGARSDLSDLVDEIAKAAADAGKGAPQVVSLHLDVTSEDSVQAAADKVGQAFGGALDVLVCNAGNLEQWLPMAESKPAEWWRTYEINVKGTYLLNRFFIPLLLKSETKTSILTTSYGALGVRPSASGYQSSKFAVCRLAEFIEAEYAAQGLVCFAIHPGGVKTELAHNMPEAMWSVLVDEPALPAHTIAWLSRERRPWLNGRFVSVTWDMEELEANKDKIVAGNLLKFRMLV
ncbi:putative short chain dehydrogenase reductase family [Rosellinia necatrix]|uniref:Putative short chain dehydrogenase reductase family n=1 Tax=Rosellinia necatrix TaxID=77044 RepID=A0A1W2TH44_ROSNE|nr:putative short chain dehydrogenase reductase family [Rosellinia necatrix]